jgi:hypothetical protein
MSGKKKKSEEKPEEAILFPEATIKGIKVKPWSFGKLFDISLALDRVVEKADERGIIEKLEDGTFNHIVMARLFTLAGPEVLEIISITVDKPIEDIKELSMEDGIKIAFTIFNQNKEKIKNALSPLLRVQEEEGQQSA